MGYAKDHAANVYRMLNLETNSIIITRDIKWLKKTYGEYIGLSNLQQFRVEPDESEKQLEVIELLDDEENFDDQESDKVEEQQDLINKQEKKKNTTMTRWQHNLQTFYNPNPGRKELAEFAFLSLLEGYNEPKTFKGAWDHQDLTERENWRSAIRKEIGRAHV